jgi:hypothetical protein
LFFLIAVAPGGEYRRALQQAVLLNKVAIALLPGCIALVMKAYGGIVANTVPLETDEMSSQLHAPAVRSLPPYGGLWTVFLL